MRPAPVHEGGSSLPRYAQRRGPEGRVSETPAQQSRDPRLLASTPGPPPFQMPSETQLQEHPMQMLVGVCWCVQSYVSRISPSRIQAADRSATFGMWLSTSRSPWASTSSQHMAREQTWIPYTPTLPRSHRRDLLQPHVAAREAGKCRRWGLGKTRKWVGCSTCSVLLSCRGKHPGHLQRTPHVSSCTHVHCLTGCFINCICHEVCLEHLSSSTVPPKWWVLMTAKWHWM